MILVITTLRGIKEFYNSQEYKFMAGLMDILADQMSGSIMDQISGQLGTDKQSTQKAVAAALPALIAGLARNANKSPDGAEALAGALERDHDGGLLENLSGLLGAVDRSDNNLDAIFGKRQSSGGLGSLIGAAGSLLGKRSNNVSEKSLDGAGILGHILGGKRPAVEAGVSKASGLDMDKVAKLLPVLAPIVMSALGKVKREKNMGPGDLAGMLQREKQEVDAASPSDGGGLMDFLDSDDDGKITDDLARLGALAGGAGLLKKMFGD